MRLGLNNSLGRENFEKVNNKSFISTKSCEINVSKLETDLSATKRCDLEAEFTGEPWRERLGDMKDVAERGHCPWPLLDELFKGYGWWVE